METEAIKVAVIMQRVPLGSRWQSHQWRPLEVSDAPLFPGVTTRRLRDDPADTRWLFSGFDIKLYSDEAEGYFLNIDAPAPCWFVMWRIEEITGDEVAVPKRITLSYNEAARLMDGGEQVDTVPASTEIIGYLTGFVQQYYRPEPKKKRRKPSFEGGSGVDQMAKAETDAHGR